MALTFERIFSVPDEIYMVESFPGAHFCMVRSLPYRNVRQEKIQPCMSHLGQKISQGSYASGKCQGNLKFFKVSELSGNFIICQGKLNLC